jgi:hypothetical protein
MPIKVDHESEQVLLPLAVYNDEQNLLGILIAGLALENDYDLVLCDSDRYKVSEPTREVRNFFVGMILGIQDKVNLTLKRKPDITELGRACAHAIRVRGEFRDNAKLTSAALLKNQDFFGNDPAWDPKTKTLKKHMLLSNYLADYLDKGEDVDSARKAITTLLENMDIERRMDDNGYKKCIKDNLVSIESIFDKHRRKPKGDTAPKKRDSKRADKGKLPSKITSSPLLTKAELGEINSFFDPLWTNLAPIQTDWTKKVLELGFGVCRDAIDLTLKTRWEADEAIAAVTTRRLRKIKTFLDDSKITKRRVTASDFESWYNKRASPEASWATEMSEITKPIRSLSKEQVVLIKYELKLWARARDLKAHVDQLKFDAMSTKASKGFEKPALKTDNRYNALARDPRTWTSVSEDYVIDMPLEPAHVILRHGNAEVNYTISVGQLEFLWDKVKDDPMLGGNAPDIGPTINGFKKTGKSGPNGTISKFVQWAIDNALAVRTDNAQTSNGMAVGPWVTLLSPEVAKTLDEEQRLDEYDGAEDFLDN